MNDHIDAPGCARRTVLKGAFAGGLMGLGFGSFPIRSFSAGNTNCS